jgi:peptidoglycan/LPS O-acetylase OafA/YrhL
MGQADISVRARPQDGQPGAESRPGRMPALDGLRVLAAFAILVTHVGSETGFSYTGTPASWVIARCDAGVPVFFVLSGFLVYGPWARAAVRGSSGPGVRRYLVRRALRILPAYWLVVFIALLTLNAGHAGSAATWLQYVLLVQNYIPHPWWGGTGAAGLAQMWSLAVEASFYLVLPPLALLLTWLARIRTTTPAQRARRLLIGLCVLTATSYGYCAALFFPHPQPWLADTLPFLLTWFAPGMALAVVAPGPARSPTPRGRPAGSARRSPAPRVSAG